MPSYLDSAQAPFYYLSPLYPQLPCLDGHFFFFFPAETNDRHVMHANINASFFRESIFLDGKLALLPLILGRVKII